MHSIPALLDRQGPAPRTGIGADRDQLQGAVCIEVSLFKDKLKKQFEAYMKVVVASNGMLPEPTGQEQWLTLGTEYVCCFVSCVQNGFKACFKNIADQDGNLSAELLSRDAELKAMIAEGWHWITLPWQAEKTWPLLCEFVQRALNVSVSVATEATEWEVASGWEKCIARWRNPIGTWLNNMRLLATQPVGLTLIRLPKSWLT